MRAATLLTCLIVLAFVLIVSTGCPTSEPPQPAQPPANPQPPPPNQGTGTPPAPPASGTSAPPASPAQTAPPNPTSNGTTPFLIVKETGKEPSCEIVTSNGTIKFLLFSKECPKAVELFQKLATTRYYDEQPFSKFEKGKAIHHKGKGKSGVVLPEEKSGYPAKRGCLVLSGSEPGEVYICLSEVSLGSKDIVIGSQTQGSQILDDLGEKTTLTRINLLEPGKESGALPPPVTGKGGEPRTGQPTGVQPPPPAVKGGEPKAGQPSVVPLPPPTEKQGTPAAPAATPGVSKEVKPAPTATAAPAAKPATPATGKSPAPAPKKTK